MHILNDIYICPHHPDAGYPEERKEYKIKCNCRKPAPGLLLKAAEDWNIDMAHSLMIGDQDRDYEAGINAGVKESIKIETNKANALLKEIKRRI
jgi:mannose-1-phosphate guanylyltransferase/phosphomannomutase